MQVISYGSNIRGFSQPLYCAIPDDALRVKALVFIGDDEEFRGWSSRLSAVHGNNDDNDIRSGLRSPSFMATCRL